MSIANPQDWEKPGGWLGGMRWGVAALAVLTAHAAAAWFFVQMPPVAAPPQGVPEAPIFIDLAPPAEAAPAAPAVETPPTEAEPVPEAVPPEPVPPEPLPPEPPPPEPVPEPVPPPPEPLPPEPVVPEPVVPEPPPEVPPPELPMTEQPAEAVINAPVPRARPAPPPEPQVTERRRPPERREAPVRREAKPRTERQATPPPSRASTARAAANASQGATPRSNVSPQRWQGQVQARLNRFKRTPRGGGTGTVQVRFTIGANGAAGGIRLTRSSGNPILDDAALSLIARASPFASPPSGSSVSITVPIAFAR